MRTKLTTRDFPYMAVMYVIWQLADYYSNLFQIIVEDNPALLLPELKYKLGHSYLVFNFQRVENMKCRYISRDIQTMLNEYLQIVLLPNAHLFLRPYKENQNDTSFIECLYVDKVHENEKEISIEVVYIDNTDAYYYVKDRKNLRGGINS